jgi:hypothetical protein
MNLSQRLQSHHFIASQVGAVGFLKEGFDHLSRSTNVLALDKLQKLWKTVLPPQSSSHHQHMTDMQRKMPDPLFTASRATNTSLRSPNTFLIYFYINKTCTFTSQNSFSPSIWTSKENLKQLTFLSNRAIDVGMTNGTGQDPKADVRILVTLT